MDGAVAMLGLSALQFLDYFGVFVFAISGALMAVRKDMDIFGMTVLALMPAIGGGTLRDLLLDLPIFWIVDNGYLLLTLAAVLFTYLGQRYVLRSARVLAWADAIGLSVFCVLGCIKTLDHGSGLLVAVVLGVVTAVAGGIMRDVVANEVPYVLQREIYATAALIGCLTFLVLLQFSVPYAEWFSILAALVARGLGIVKGWSLPAVNKLGKE